MSTYIPDPRIAATTAEGIEGELVIMDQCNIGGRLIEFPRLLAGAPQYASVFAAERQAERLRPMLLEDLDERGHAPWQTNAPLVIGMQSTAGTVVANAMVGMEAFVNHFVHSHATAGMVNFAGRQETVDYTVNIAINERYTDVLPALLNKPKPTSEPWWSTFRRIQGLAVLQRLGLYEPMGRSGLDGVRSYVERIYTGEYRGAASMMVSAFNYYAPGWFSEERQRALENIDLAL